MNYKIKNNGENQCNKDWSFEIIKNNHCSQLLRKKRENTHITVSVTTEITVSVDY